MSDQPFVPESTRESMPIPATATGMPVFVPATAAVEIVPRGILWSLGAIPLGMAATVIIWKLGFVASITSFLMAGGAAFLYTRGARSAPRRGLVPLVGVIVVGVVACFFAIVAADLSEVYYSPVGQSLGYPSVVGFVSNNLFNTAVLGHYGMDLVMFFAFAALGVFSTLRRLMRGRVV